MTGACSLESRARATRGEGSDAVYARTRELLLSRRVRGRVADIGCGRGRLFAVLDGIADSYIGVDLLRFDGFPSPLDFRAADLDRDPLPLEPASCDATVALETIEHLENPRRFMRELARVTRPGGAIVVSTPNQRSLLSLATLLVRGEHGAFQEADYPAHITALLESDLRRLAGECGLCGTQILYSESGRVALTAARYPRWLSRAFPRALSDNVLLAAEVTS